VVESTFLFGIGITAVTFFFRYAVSVMPKSIAWAGVAAGIILMAIGLFPSFYRPPLSAIALFVCGMLLIGAAVHITLSNASNAGRDSTTTLIPATKTTNTTGYISNNSGIITQGQKGDNVQ
jgi:hypothetical protein